MYDDILGDIERDLNRDWSEIYKERKEYKSKINKDRFNSYFNIIDSLVGLNKLNRSSIESFTMSNYDYYLNHCSIFLNSGRDCGNTSYIISRATENDCVITTSISNRDFIKRMTEDKVSVFYINSMVGSKICEPEKIYVDNFSFIKTKEYSISKIFNYLGRIGKEQTFIFLG